MEPFQGSLFSLPFPGSNLLEPVDALRRLPGKRLVGVADDVDLNVFCHFRPKRGRKEMGKRIPLFFRFLRFSS